MLQEKIFDDSPVAAVDDSALQQDSGTFEDRESYLSGRATYGSVNLGNQQRSESIQMSDISFVSNGIDDLATARDVDHDTYTAEHKPHT